MPHPLRKAGFAILAVAISVGLSHGCKKSSSKRRKPLEILTVSLLPAAEALPYAQQVEAQGGRTPYAWDLSMGTLPAGLTLDPATGMISGTPAAGESAQSPFAIQVRVTDARASNPAVVTRDYALVVDPPGGVGGGPPTGTITVAVVEAETSQPIQGAFVMIGPDADNPFVGNFQTTGPNGVATFTDPALDRPATPPVVTAGATGRQYMSVYGANASQFVLPLKLILDPTTKVPISGMVTGQNTTQYTNLHAAIVMPPLRLSELFKLRLENLILGEECVCVSCGKALLPANLSYPQQDIVALIDGDDVPEKRYTINLEDGSQIHLGASAGYIDAATLAAFMTGGNPNRLELFSQLRLEGFGVVLDYPVSGPATVDIPITPGVGNPVDVTILRTPRGTDAFMATAADIDGAGGTGQIIVSGFGFVARDLLLPQTEVMDTVPDVMPGVGTPYKVSVAVAFFDPYSGILPLPPLDVENAYSVVADRTSPLAPPGVFFESFLDLIPLDAAVNISGGNRTFTFASAQDATNPTSPVPDYTLSRIEQVWEVTPPQPPDPYPGQYCPPQSGLLFTCDDIPGPPPICPAPSNVSMSRTYWEVYTPGSTTDTTFDLPTLPPSAPRVGEGGLFDPAATPEPLDRFRWTVFSFHAGLDPSFDFDAFNFGAMDDLTTHVSLNFVQY